MRKQLFVSYSRDDIDAVLTAVGYLDELGHQVWYDRELSGGDPWWSTILEQIRASNAFVYAVSPASLESEACAAELAYANSLQRPIVPLMCDRVSPDLLPEELSQRQVVDLTQSNERAVIALARAISEVPDDVPLPVPLPPAPPAPMASFHAEFLLITSETGISLRDQRDLVFQLETRATKHNVSTVVSLLNRLSERPDIFKVVAVDELPAALARLNKRFARPEPAAGSPPVSERPQVTPQPVPSWPAPQAQAPGATAQAPQAIQPAVPSVSPPMPEGRAKRGRAHAIVALICSLAGLLLVPIVGGFYFGYRARKELKGAEGSSSSIALVAIVITWLWVGFWVLALIGAATGPGSE
jgi:hypothetical protein